MVSSHFKNCSQFFKFTVQAVPEIFMKEWSTNAFCFLSRTSIGNDPMSSSFLTYMSFPQSVVPLPTHLSKCMLSSVIVVLSSEMKQVCYPNCSKYNLRGKVVLIYNAVK